MRDDDPVKLIGGLLEPEAEMWRELLTNAGVRAFVKIVDPVALSEGRATGTNCVLFVKRTDLGRAREILGPRLTGRSRGRRPSGYRKHGAKR